ncbi:ABC transporter ATP-binding protein [Mucilaginibacter pallidiroseus]|uniref:ABC transporter ATP-binding protein n=1 Tax=Mucilaginibacter pallidiroseus TaxID=2599295 RepID=A0A563U364_9SPHI|nr:ABC transporter ATP-binding protein [Mucilaginibacter pallidiroseus]TWR25788.1 ABC transporter ATP-binding protein [Mucilaginibacter pallidiroseus]
MFEQTQTSRPGNNLILETIAVTKNYFGDKSSGVNNITVFVPQGKITAIVGESGSGKTTLLKLLAGMLKPDSGDVFFHGQPMPLRSIASTEEHYKIAMVSQDNHDMDPAASVWENIGRGLPMADKNYELPKITEALTLLGIYDLRDMPFGKLSGGEKQRVTIAKALINKPEVLMLDEPFNQVDAAYREGLQHDIRQIVKEWNVTVLLVSHDPAELLSMADELIVIKEGEIVENGTPEELYHSPKLLYTSKILVSCSEMTAAQARVCGIKSKRGTVVVYAEHVSITNMPMGAKWTVKQVLFKGFFEELIIERDEVNLRVLNPNRGKHPVGSKIGISIKKFYEFGRWLS